MSETEKYEQVGRLAEEYSHLKGQLNHINEKISRAYVACQVMSQNVNRVQVIGGHLQAPNSSYPVVPDTLQHLLSSKEFIEVLEEKTRLEGAVSEIANRIKALAPHLLQ